MVLGKVDSYMYKNEIRIFPYTIYKNKINMDQRHKYKTETMKFIEENTSETLFDIKVTLSRRQLRSSKCKYKI